MRDNTDIGSDSGIEAGLIVITPARPGSSAGEISRALAESFSSAQETCRDEEESVRFGEFLNFIGDGSLVADLSGRITAADERCCELVQMSAGELKRLQVRHLISGADKSLMTTVSHLLDRNRRARIVADVLRKDGSALQCEIDVGPVTIGGRARAVFVMRVCSRRERSEGVGRSADAAETVSGRIETAATVAGQIAHDFDNLLTPLSAYPELIRKDLPEKCRGRELLDIMEQTARDMCKITRQLLVLSKRGQHKMAPFNINEVAAHVAGLLHDHAAERNIEIRTNLAGDPFAINGVPEQMLRVVQNLCQNAIDAIDGRGQIDVVTKNVHVDSPREFDGRLEAGDYVELKVSDNGSGIPGDVIEKIFDPFFTTRRTSKNRGSGLGLSVVRAVVDDHNGTILVDSTIGKGTTFTLYFPACRPEPQGVKEVGARQCPSREQMSGVQSGETAAVPRRVVPRNADKILVVDDEQAIRKLFRMILSDAFPKADITLAENGADAVASFQDAHHAVIVMDLKMPILSGEAAFEKIRDHCLANNWEQPRVVFCTGFAPPDVVRNIVAGGGGHSILPKPVSGDALVSAVGANLSSAT